MNGLSWSRAVVVLALGLGSVTWAQGGAWRLEGSRFVDGVWVNDGKSGVTWEGQPGALVYTQQQPGFLMKCAYRWSAPPATIAPEQVLQLQARAEMSVPPSGGYHGCSMSMWFDNAVRDTSSGGNVNLFANSGGTPSVSFPGQARVSEKVTNMKAPSAGFGDAQKRLYLRVVAGSGRGEGGRAVIYSYAWNGSGGPAPLQPLAPTGTPRTLFDNWNKGGVGNGPSAATTFTLAAPATITRIMNYHWNGGRGQALGTIALRGSDGRAYGPWSVTALPSAVPTANWVATPNVRLPPGTYTVVDSHPATWSQNPGSGGAGFSQVSGF